MGKRIIYIVVVIVVVLGLFMLFGKQKVNNNANIVSFEECLQAGYQILESYPRQCVTPQGEVFKEIIGTISPSPTSTGTASSTDVIKITSPAINGRIKSPVVIKGEAPGPWYFEASFPITIKDATGKVIGQGHAQATADWMTTAQVPFEATVTFTKPTTNTGSIELKNDNPSGDPIRDKFFTIPVTFEL